jgi:cellulose synthase/poly-beta-1,6-N-acetylglucosamine synthase-like glycosyltransferase
LIAKLVHDVWDVIGAVALCAALPGSVELLLLSAAALLPDQRKNNPSGNSIWRVAIVVPAHNEAASIESCVRSLLSADGGGMQVDVQVIADNCTDGTALVARQAGASVLIRTNDAERGKGYALNFAFTQLAALGYDCVLIVDADTAVARNFITAAAGALRDGADAVQARYLVRNVNEGVRTRLMSIALCAFNVVRPLGRERLGLSVGIFGNGFGLRFSTLRAIPYLAASVVEDLEYHLSLVQAGFRVRFIDETAVFGEIPVQGEGVKTQRARWEGGRLRMIGLAAPKLLRGVLSGRLILMEPLLELLLLPLAFHVTLLALAVSAPLAAVRYTGLAGIAIVLLHLGVAIRVGGGNWRDVGTLAMAPFYVLWKLRMVPSLLRNARSSHAWVRTRRNAEPQLADDASSSGPH